MQTLANISGLGRAPLSSVSAGCRQFAHWWCALFCLALAPDSLATEESNGNLESQVKAAFIVKFASFIEWPPMTVATNGHFSIGILGKDPFGKNFDEAARRERVKGRPVEVRRANKAEQLADCQIIFIADSELDRLDEIVRSFASKPVLLVTDEPGAVQHGSMINFFKEDSKVRFEFNLDAATQANLRFSAKLLQVGRVVVPPPADERRLP